MNQTAMRCLTAFVIAAWAASAPLHAAVLQNHGPATGFQPQPQPQLRPAAVPGPIARAEASPPKTKPKAGKRQTYPFRGVVAAIDTTAKTVTLEGRTTRRVIAITDETRLVRDGAAAALGDLKSGESIGGTLRKTPDGRELALLIRVGIKPDPKAAGRGRPASGDGADIPGASAGR
ncbi:MAG: hypothetical protein Q7T30_00065 [Planctomycetota bacterium]|nr:hypothetical protein [Planctomycetota bacterium]